MFRNKFFLLFVGISIFLAGYLYYVKKEREQSIERYFYQPKVGDIYKIKVDDEEGSSWVQYWKVLETHEKGVVFAASKFEAWASADYLLKHFNELLPFSYSHQDLKEIKDGKWNNDQHRNISLIDIKRKN